MQFRTPAFVAAAALAVALAACTDSPDAPHAGPVSPPVAALHSVTPASAPVFDAGSYVTGHPSDTLLLEADGSMSVQSQSDYDFFWNTIAPKLNAWATDARLGINPNYVAAILTKESGFDSLAVSWMPANGLPQMTYIADADMQQMVTDSAFLWMQPEVAAWLRDPVVHSSSASYTTTESGLQQGSITALNEYFFNPVQAVRGAAFWLRLLKNKWTTDSWPGGYGTFARNKLNGGAPLTESQLVDLVTVSYNQGYDWVYSLVDQYGTSWVSALPQQGSAGTEAADYLDRVRNFTGVYEDAASAATGTTGTTSTSGGTTTGMTSGTASGTATGTATGTAAGTTTGTSTPVVTVPAAPANTGIWRENKTTIGVSWNDMSSNETGFRVYRSANGGAFTLVGTAGGNVVRYWDSTFSRGVTYRYAVSAYNGAGESTRVVSGKLYAR